MLNCAGDVEIMAGAKNMIRGVDRKNQCGHEVRKIRIFISDEK